MGELRSRMLEQVPGLHHGFGTREGPLTQDGMVSLQQIHSDVVLVADRAEGCVGPGDALLTGRAGWILSVRTADCFPVLLVDPVRRAVAAVHAGWRGIASGIVAASLARMRDEFGTQAQDVLAAIGPGIGACCYEVGEEVARRFGKNCAGRLDLAAAITAQLEQAGVPRAHVDYIPECTSCDAARFHSWRRDRKSDARMISYVSIQD
jgi:purine-nucleoside/S-methyl-5'-thioadenosine phosphorylase / adenosine deaminase